MFMLSGLALCLSGCGGGGSSAPEVVESAHRASSFHEYRVFSWNDALTPDWVTERPAPADPTIHFCIAAAFTRAGDYEVDGAFAVNGIWEHTGEANPKLGAALVIERDGTQSRVSVPGKVQVGADLLARVTESGADCFQQLSVVVDGQAQAFRDKALYVRRALVEKTNGTWCVVESQKEASLNQFAVDLVEFGAQNALYTDMGSFDEGWFRYAGAPIALGRSRSQTALQSNWWVLRTR